MEGYTKGEWKVEYQQYEDGSHICVADPSGDWVCDCGLEGDIECEANAQLIASAPDLYKACKLGLEKCESFIHDEYDGTSMLGGLLKKLEPIRKALAKAEGTK